MTIVHSANHVQHAFSCLILKQPVRILATGFKLITVMIIVVVVIIIIIIIIIIVIIIIITSNTLVVFSVDLGI